MNAKNPKPTFVTHNMNKMQEGEKVQREREKES